MAYQQETMDVSVPRETETILSQAFEAKLKDRESRRLRRKLQVAPLNSVDFCSNDYLSFSDNLQFQEKYLQYLQEGPYITKPSKPIDGNHFQGFASGGSRLLFGNSRLAENLERSIARFHDAESGLIFNSGYDANIGCFSVIPQKGDILIYDSLIHASIIDGMRLSRAGAKVAFPHNSPEGLKNVLQQVLEKDADVRENRKNVFVIVESVYSMDGDSAPLDQFQDIIDSLFPHHNGHMIVDEAHATGAYGPRGAGVVQALGLQRRVFLRIHTFGKGLSAHGAVVLGSEKVREYLINFARSFIFTTSLPYPMLMMVRVAYEMLDSEEGDHLRNHHADLIDYMDKSLRSVANSTGKGHPAPLQVKHEAGSPIFLLLSRNSKEIGEFCQQNGYMALHVTWPAVPPGEERVRLCLHAGNSTEDIDGLTATLKTWVKKNTQTEARL